MSLILHLAVLVNIYAVIAISLNLVAGFGGMLSLSHAAFYGIGAYTTALLTLRLDWGFLPTLAAGAVLSALVAVALGAIVLRLKEELFVIATFALQLVLQNVMLNWTELTNGPLGIANIPRPVIFGWRVTDIWEFAIIGACLLGGALWLVTRLVRSPFGRVLQAIREDEVLARSQGHDVEYFKVVSFVLSAGLAAVGGSLYAVYYSYIDPGSFSIHESILILAMVIIGGAASVWGPVVGAAILVCLPEILRFVGLPTDIAAHLRQVIYGLCIAAIMLWRPRGIMGREAFGRAGGRD